MYKIDTKTNSFFYLCLLDATLAPIAVPDPPTAKPALVFSVMEGVYGLDKKPTSSFCLCQVELVGV